MNKKSARIFVIFLVIQSLAVAALLVSSGHVILLSNKVTQRENIQTVKALTESYAQTVKTINENYKGSQDVVPSVRDVLEELKETLDEISNKTIRIKIIKVKIKPFGKSSAIRKSQKALSKSITVLNSYEQKTQPAMLKCLQETEKTLLKLNNQLNEEQEDIRFLPWHIAGILLSIALIMCLNTVFLIYMYKQQSVKV